MTSTPAWIPLGTVASRVQTYQQNINSRQDNGSMQFSSNEAVQHERDDIQHDNNSTALNIEPATTISTEDESSEDEESRPNPDPCPTPNSDRPSLSPAFVQLSSRLSRHPCAGQRLLSNTFDGPTQLAAARSQLRCIKEHDGSQGADSDGKESVLSELDSLIQSAINEQQNDKSNPQPHVTSLQSQTPSKQHIFSPPMSPTEQMNKLYMLDKSDALTRIKGGLSDHGTDPISTEYGIVREEDAKTNEHFLTPEVLSTHRPGEQGSVLFPSAQVDMNSSLHPGGTKSQLHILPTAGSEVNNPCSLSKLPSFPRYRSNTVGRTVPAAEIDKNRQCRRLTSHSVRHRSTTSGSTSSTPICSRASMDRHLLPLHLPHIVAGRPCSQQKNQRPWETAPVDVARQPYGKLNDEAMDAKRQQVLANDPADAEGNASQQVRDGITESSHSTKKRSVIEDKIHDLLVAARRQEKELDAKRRESVENSRAREGLLKENVRLPEDLDFKTLPSFQAPNEDQANTCHDQRLPQTPRKICRCSSAASPTLREHTNNLPSPLGKSPLRSGSRQIRDSVSPRGSIYTVEQRLAISPSRSHSRTVANAVRVSVELRRSPERGDTDDQMLFVRASVEPDDAQEIDAAV